MNPRALRVNPSDAVPIWKQIEEGLRRLVASGAIAPEGPVPSVRDLARELRVNPATVAKAYQRLTEAGVLQVRRGEGTFVSSAPPPFGKGEKGRLLKDGAMRYASGALTIGATQEEAMDELKSAWTRLGKGGKGGER